jgi:hypothetical protein
MGIKSLKNNGYKNSKDSNAFDTSAFDSSKGVVLAEALLIGGGGAGGVPRGGGGGAGGVVYVNNLNFINGVSYSITVGYGGRPSSFYKGSLAKGLNGGHSSITGEGINCPVAYGGGGGGGGFSGLTGSGFSGASGGGGAVYGTTSRGAAGGPFASQGNSGGLGFIGGEGYNGGGGGGAGNSGGNATTGGGGGVGGIGTNAYSVWATATSSGDSGYFAGGGSGGTYWTSAKVAGGTGGGGRGGDRGTGSAGAPLPGTTNTGGGGGGGGNDDAGTTFTGGYGGSGLVIIRTLDTVPDPDYYTGTKYVTGGYKYYKFNVNSSIRWGGSQKVTSYTNFPVSQFQMYTNNSGSRSAQPGNYFGSVTSLNSSYMFAVSSTDSGTDKGFNAFEAGPVPQSNYWRFNGSGVNNYHDQIDLYMSNKETTITSLTYYTYPQSDYALDTVALSYWDGTQWINVTGLGYASLSGWNTSGPGSAGSYNPVTFTFSGTQSEALAFKSKYWRIYFPPGCLVGTDGIHGHGASNLNFITFE